MSIPRPLHVIHALRGKIISGESLREAPWLISYCLKQPGLQ